ncbi:MAG TPA: hypothetical protein VIK89_11055 [Cytophagaceae bacterium]
MCKCNPRVKTLFCGKPGCQWPKEENNIITYRPSNDVFTIPGDSLFDLKDLDGKEVKLRIITDSGYTSIYAKHNDKLYFLGQVKSVQGCKNENKNEMNKEMFLSSVGIDELLKLIEEIEKNYSVNYHIDDTGEEDGKYTIILRNAKENVTFSDDVAVNVIVNAYNYVMGIE